MVQAIFTHILQARVVTHVLARVVTHVLARVIMHVHDYYLKTCRLVAVCTLESLEWVELQLILCGETSTLHTACRRPNTQNGTLCCITLHFTINYTIFYITLH